MFTTVQNVQKNEKNGQLRIDNLNSSVCLGLTEYIHGKEFYKRKVYVTSVVEKTPEKVDDPAESSESDSTAYESETEEPLTASKPPCSKLFSKMSAPIKRPAKSSPEASAETGKRDKKKKKGTNEPNTLRSSSRQGKSRNQN